MIQQRANFDWMLRELAEGVVEVRQVVVLSADGLRIAQYGGDPDAADRLSAACSGLQSLASAVASEIPASNGKMKMVIIEVDHGYFYMMAAGKGAYLAVLTDRNPNAGIISHQMRELVARLGGHLTSPPRQGGRPV